MCKFFVQVIERDKPNAIGLPVFGYIVSEIEPKEFDDMDRESNIIISLEVMDYKNSKLQDIRDEVYKIIQEIKPEIKKSDIAYSDLDMEVTVKTFIDMLAVARYQYEYKEL